MFLNNFVFAGKNCGPVNLYILHFETEFFGALEVIINVRMVQENLRRDAADMQASAAEKRIFLNHGHF